MKTIPLSPAGESASRQTAAPPFARVGVVGLGRMGGALGLAIRRAWPSALVVGVDANDALERAMRWHAIDVGGSDLVMLRDVELIVLTGSAEQDADVLAALADCVPGPAVVTATCGAPEVADAARALPPGLTFVEGELVEAATDRDAAFPEDSGWPAGRDWRLAAAAASDDRASVAAVERLRAFVTALGVIPRVAS